MTSQASYENENIYSVEKILECKVEKNQKLYLVKWKNYGHNENTWEPKESFDICPEVLTEFEHSLLPSLHLKRESGRLFV